MADLNQKIMDIKNRKGEEPVFRGVFADWIRYWNFQKDYPADHAERDGICVLPEFLFLYFELY